MAGKTVNPTRMELTRLKGRLKTASRGHKLLKDKRDEQMRQFMILVRRSRQLRAQVEQALAEAQGAFTVAAAVMSPEMLQQALMCPKQRLELETGTRNIMGVETPVYHLQWQNDDPADLLPYGFAQTSGELDTAIETMGGVLPQMLELAETEKAVCQRQCAHLGIGPNAAHAFGNGLLRLRTRNTALKGINRQQHTAGPAARGTKIDRLNDDIFGTRERLSVSGMCLKIGPTTAASTIGTTQPTKIPAQHLTTLVCQHAGGHIKPMIQARVGIQIV